MRPPERMPLPAMTMTGRAVWVSWFTAIWPAWLSMVIRLSKASGFAAGLDAFAGLVVTIRLQAAIRLGETSRQGRVEDDRQREPGCRRQRAAAAFGSGRRA